MTTYCFSTDDECFHSECEAEDIEAAAAIADAELGLGPGESFYVGLREEVRAEQHLHAHKILEDIGEQIYEEVGEICEGWPEVTTAEVDDLERRLREVFTAWMEETGCVPTFHRVVDVQGYIAGDDPITSPPARRATR